MTKVLFVGTYLSHIVGSKGICELVAERVQSKNLKCILVSRHRNKILRLFDIIKATLVFSGNKVHIDVFSGYAFIISEFASAIASFKKKEIILTLRGGMLPDFSEKYSYRINRVFKRATTIQTPSLYLKQYFEKVGYQINYLPNPLPLERFPYNRTNVNSCTLLWVRAFRSIYNPQLAVKILQEVRKQYPRTTLTMVGPDNGLLKDTIKYIKKCGLEKYVFITGAVPNEELYKYYQTHEVYLNTTSYESFGNAVVEAASCGIPVVSSKVGEIPYLWQHKKDIMLAEELNAFAFAKHVIELFDNEDLKTKLSKAARTKAEGFNWEKIRSYWIKLLDSN